MTFRTFKIVFVALFFFLLAKANAQSFDFNGWYGFKYERELHKDIDFAIEQELRLEKLQTKFGSTLTQVDISYKPFKRFAVDGGYRLTYQRSWEHRFFGGFTLKAKPNKDWQLNFRTRYQTEKEYLNPFTHDIREKVTVKYEDFKDWRPYIYGEVWLHLQYDFKSFNRYRIGFGNEIDLKKGHDLDVAIFYQKQFNVEAPEQNITLSIAYIIN